MIISGYPTDLLGKRLAEFISMARHSGFRETLRICIETLDAKQPGRRENLATRFQNLKNPGSLILRRPQATCWQK